MQEIIKQTPKFRKNKWVQDVFYFENKVKVKAEQFVLTEVEAHNALNPNNKKYVLNPRTFAVKLLGTPLFNELNKWLTQSPLIQDLVEDGVLTEEELTAFKAQLDLDLGEQKISQELYNVILGELSNEG